MSDPLRYLDACGKEIRPGDIIARAVTSGDSSKLEISIVFSLSERVHPEWSRKPPTPTLRVISETSDRLIPVDSLSKVIVVSAETVGSLRAAALRDAFDARCLRGKS